jgi:hypothetical protein
MDSHNGKNSSVREDEVDKPTAGPRKKPYAAPRLLEWGSITELTHGAQKTGTVDFPLKGGTHGV